MRNISTARVKTFTDVDRELDSLRKALQDLQIYYGNGSPLNVVAAPIGAIYLDLVGSTSTTLYVKEDDNNKNSGWVAK